MSDRDIERAADLATGHACAYVRGVCVLEGAHGGQLSELADTEYQAIEDRFGATGVAAAELLLRLRYGGVGS